MKKAKLGDICTIVSGSTPKTSKKEYWDGNLRWITPAEIADDSYFIYDTERYITEAGAMNAHLNLLPIGTVLLSSRAPIGKVAIAGAEMYCNQGFKNLICSPCVNNCYLYYYLKSKKDYLNSLGRGATFKEISRQIVSEIEIPLPELDEQQRIVRQFDLLAKLCNTKHQQIDLLELAVKSRFVELFGNPVINQKRFPVKQVGDVIDFIGGSQPPKNVFEYTPTEENIRLIQIRDYRTDKYKTYIPRKLAKRFCTADDIMIGRYGPPIFQILGGIEGSYNVALMKAVPKMGNREFIRWFLKQECLLHYLEGMSKRTAGQDGIQMDKLKKYPFPYPPIELQNQFANFAKQLDKSRLAVQKSLDELEILKKSLMQQYFG